MQTYSNCASSQLGPSCGIKTEQEAKDVLPNRNRKQATKRAEKMPFFCSWWLWPLALTFKLVRAWTKHVFRVNLVQIRSVLPEISAKNPVFVPGDLGLCPWHSNSSERGTKHVFHVLGTSPFSGSRDISYTNRKVTDSAKNRTFWSSLHMVKS